MVLFVNNNSGVLFIVVGVIAEIWIEIKKLSSIITNVLNIESPID